MVIWLIAIDDDCDLDLWNH